MVPEVFEIVTFLKNGTVEIFLSVLEILFCFFSIVAAAEVMA